MVDVSQFLHSPLPLLEEFLNWLKEFAPLGAVVVFALAFWQYHRAESWKKTEFVAKLFKEFSDSEDCRNARWFLEGDERTIHYKEGSTDASYVFNNTVLEATLDKASAQEKLTPAELHMLDSFDAFFIYIEQFERAIRRRLVTKGDVYPYLGYWIAVLQGEDPDVSPPKPLAQKINSYINDARFDDVQAFLKRRW